MNNNNNIPKIIHYCWFGPNKKPNVVQKCINSWRKHLPEYEIREWNDSHLNLINIPYVQEAYKAKKYAFVSDVFRLYALNNFGGIYLDTDVKVFKSLNPFLCLNFFCSFENYYGNINAATSVLGATKNCTIIKDLLDEYNQLHFISAGQQDLTPNTIRLSAYFKKKFRLSVESDQYIKQLGNEGVIFPSNWFIKYQPKFSFSCHLFNGSWLPKKKYTIYQKIFSITNQNNYKVCYFLGIRFNIKKLNTL